MVEKQLTAIFEPHFKFNTSVLVLLIEVGLIGWDIFWKMIKPQAVYLIGYEIVFGYL